MQIKYIDGPRLHQAIQAGVNHVITRKDYLKVRFGPGSPTGMPRRSREKTKTYFEKFGAKKIISTEIGPALGVHAGPGALVIAIQSLKDDLNG